MACVVTISFTLAGQPFVLSDDDVRACLAQHQPGQIHRYWVDVDGTRWPVKQALSLATSLSNREFQSQTSRRLLAKLGFTIGSENSTSVSPRARVRATPRMGGASADQTPTEPDIVLVSCVKSKLSHGAPAKQLYTSDYFTKMRNYAEASGHPWFIISAEHGLVQPDEWLEPYDCYLPTMPGEYRHAWGRRVREQLESSLGALAGTTFEIHAGAAYVDAIRPELTAADAVVIDKLHGRSIGQRLSWYLQPTTAVVEAASEIVELLRDGSRPMPLGEVLGSGDTSLRAPGLYSWWVDDGGAADLAKGLERDIAPGFIYVGLAGATRKGGGRSSNTLWGRIATMHLGKNHQFSTLRLSLGATLAGYS